MVTLSNPTTAAIPLVSSFSPATPFTYGGTGTCATTVPASSSCTISARYHPTSTTPASASLLITLAGKLTPIPLKGTVAIAPPVLKPNLSWTPSGTAGVTGYNILRASTSGGPYSKVNPAPVTGLGYRDASATTGTWFYVATAIGSDGTESIRSNQVTMVVP